MHSYTGAEFYRILDILDNLPAHLHGRLPATAVTAIVHATCAHGRLDIAMPFIEAAAANGTLVRDAVEMAIRSAMHLHRPPADLAYLVALTAATSAAVGHLTFALVFQYCALLADLPTCEQLWGIGLRSSYDLYTSLPMDSVLILPPAVAICVAYAAAGRPYHALAMYMNFADVITDAAARHSAAAAEAGAPSGDAAERLRLHGLQSLSVYFSPAYGSLSHVISSLVLQSIPAEERDGVIAWVAGPTDALDDAALDLFRAVGDGWRDAVGVGHPAPADGAPLNAWWDTYWRIDELRARLLDNPPPGVGPVVSRRAGVHALLVSLLSSLCLISDSPTLRRLWSLYFYPGDEDRTHFFDPRTPAHVANWVSPSHATTAPPAAVPVAAAQHISLSPATAAYAPYAPSRLTGQTLGPAASSDFLDGTGSSWRCRDTRAAHASWPPAYPGVAGGAGSGRATVTTLLRTCRAVCTPDAIQAAVAAAYETRSYTTFYGALVYSQTLAMERDPTLLSQQLSDAARDRDYERGFSVYNLAKHYGVTRVRYM